MKICDLAGVGWYYIPGADPATCVNVYNGKTRTYDSSNNLIGTGETPLAARFHDAFEGVAGSLAIPTPMISQGDHFALAANWGQFLGYNALGVALAARVNEHLDLTAGMSLGLEQHDFGTRVGFNLSW